MKKVVLTVIVLFFLFGCVDNATFDAGWATGHSEGINDSKDQIKVKDREIRDLGRELERKSDVTKQCLEDMRAEGEEFNSNLMKLNSILDSIEVLEESVSILVEDIDDLNRVIYDWNGGLD